MMDQKGQVYRDQPRIRSILDGMASDGRHVAVEGGDRISAQEALERFESDPGEFRLVFSLTRGRGPSD